MSRLPCRQLPRAAHSCLLLLLLLKLALACLWPQGVLDSSGASGGARPCDSKGVEAGEGRLMVLKSAA